MWIASQFGWISCVWKQGAIVVRARVKKDLENINDLMGWHTPIVDDEGTDYPFRMKLSRNGFIDMLAEMAARLSYGNFKDFIHTLPDQKTKPYGAIWGIMRRYEDDEARKLKRPIGGLSSEHASMDAEYQNANTAEREFMRLSGDYSPSAKPEEITAEVNASKRRFENYTPEQRKAFGDKARQLAGKNKSHKKSK